MIDKEAIRKLLATKRLRDMTRQERASVACAALAWCNKRLTAKQGNPVSDSDINHATDMLVEDLAHVSPASDMEREVIHGAFDLFARLYASLSPTTPDQDAVEAQRYAKFKELALADEAPYLFHGKWWYMEREYETCDAALDAAMLKEPTK